MSVKPPLFPAAGRIRAWALACALAVVALALGGCASAAAPKTAQAQKAVLHEATDSNIGISSTADGYTFDSAISVLGPSQEYKFRILGPDGQPVTTGYVEEQTKLLHFYGIRDDLTGYVHVHPVMAPDGTWSVHLPLPMPGPYHVYAGMLLRDAANKVHILVLRRPVSMPGPYQLSPILPAPSMSAEADGYTITFTTPPKAWTVMLFPAKVTRNGQPATDLEGYLNSYAHMTAFKAGTLLYGHAHPLEYVTNGQSGGPMLTFHTEFPGSGDYRLFIEIQTGGKLHNLDLTVHVP